MTQITGGVSMVDGVVEISTNGSVWTDISGASTEVSNAEQARKTGEAYTYDGDTAIITAGKREPMEIEFKFVYTEGASDAFEIVRAQFETANGGALYARWSPKAAVNPNFRFTSPAGHVSNFIYPTAPAEEAAPIIAGFTLKVPYVTKAAVP